MKNTILSVVAVFSMAGAAFAEEAVTAPVLSGEVSLDFAETANDKWGGTMGLELGINAAGLGTVDLDFEAVDGGAVTLENWTVGTTFGSVDVAFGDDLGVMVESFDEDHNTLATPAMSEAVRVTVGDAAVALGFTDWTADITDVSNVQGAYTMGVAGLDVTAAADYNLDTENFVLGAGIAGVELGTVGLSGVVTWDNDAEAFGYEAVADAYGVTAYVNGDDTDAFQNIGGEYVYNLGGAALTAGVNYNIDTEDFAPTAGISFNF